MKRAFSLIELLVALSILAVVAAIIVPRFLNLKGQAESTVVESTKKQIEHSYEQWRALGGSFSGNLTAEGCASAFIRLISSSGANRSIASNQAGTIAQDGGGALGSSVIGLNVQLKYDTDGSAITTGSPPGIAAGTIYWGDDYVAVVDNLGFQLMTIDPGNEYNIGWSAYDYSGSPR